MAQTKLSIGEVASLLGITPKAIRHYHEMELLPDPERSEGGYRLYGIAELRQLQTILRLQRLGLSLKQIRFILTADNPDELLRHLLEGRQQEITDQIARLHDQQKQISRALDEGIQLDQPDTPAKNPSSAIIVHDILRPRASGFADILREVEGQAMDELDRYEWPDAYDAFWEHIARQLIQQLRIHESPFILWLERYLALAHMTPDDRQAQAWLNELQHSADRWILSQAFTLPPGAELPATEQMRIQRLLPQLLVENAHPLQQAFIALLFMETK